MKTNKDCAEVAPRGIHQSDLDTLNPAGRYLDEITHLPPAPLLLTKLLTLFKDPNYDIDQVVQIIGYEPFLTAQLLRTVNSACFAGEQATADIFGAVTRLGVYQVYCLVTAIYGSKMKSLPGTEKAVDVKLLWRHAVGVAVASSVVANDIGQARAEAFTAGLLHDIGKLVLASAEGEAYARAIETAKTEGALLIDLERRAFVIDHAELGGELMQRWNMPPEVATAVRCHHGIEAAAPYEHVTGAVRVGNMIAHQIFDADLSDTDIPTHSAVALDTLQLTPDDVPRLHAKAQAEMEDVKHMLEI